MLIVMAPNLFNERMAIAAAASASSAGEDAPQAQAALVSWFTRRNKIKKEQLQMQRDESRKLRSVARRLRVKHHEDEEKNIFDVDGKGKESKPDPFCKELEQVLACGQTFTNEKVVLSDDLTCTDKVEGASDQVLGTLNAGITLVGPSASLDCKGHTVRQVTTKFASNCELYEDDGAKPGHDDACEGCCSRIIMKKDCKLYYQAGIMLKDGATAKNCRTEQFYEGILVLNGGKVEDSEATGNADGIFVQDDVGSKSEVSNV